MSNVQVNWCGLMVGLFLFTNCGTNPSGNTYQRFPPEVVTFTAYSDSSLFSGTDSSTWDKEIRERGFIIHDEGQYKMWYTGYNSDSSAVKFLGYAVSDDGINWERYPKNPIYREKWTEDVFVLKDEGLYYMFAEGENDVAHLLTSTDGIRWESKGSLIIQSTKGDTIPEPYGTPVVFSKEGTWHLFYEREDSAIWVATSVDKLHWRNIQDEPVLIPGPKEYDKGAVAANQIVEFDGKYYMYYHATSNPDWNKGGSPVYWNSNVAVSEDLINWEKYPNNPLVENNESSPVTVWDGKKPRLYTMHKNVHLYLPN
ncbi:glycosylase [Parapedobacter indicus]|uniref:Glycosyl hydrolases family 43 n=1 Tax=Parapedobacter indicus TaxID=1477437 RepID=A0A1I3RP81_9SPHI|nr:glycosylase [Parapedobacter indicus]PPL00052.1 hypothetical protein CLV26_110180 [Parapedobacter indicus]SFJ47702.1 hypothetical protein SAMN05444682_11066 [Parapedobacter indicus]